MSAQTYSADRDLSEARSMAEALDGYVRDDALYGQVGGWFGSGKMPSLTIGALLLRLKRLQALRETLSPAQQRQLDEIQARHDAARREWRVHYDQKMLREARSRLEAMRGFFEECDEDPRVCAPNYPPELLRLTIAHQLAVELADARADANGLDGLLRLADSRVRSLTEPADFQWAAPLRPAYPQAVYWWLYVRPPIVLDKDKKK